ncbi:MAG: alpha-L-fucosidase [Coprobacter sp.]|nr:alpha-L-fucosidase [Coprobacter sp.]
MRKWIYGGVLLSMMCWVGLPLRAQHIEPGTTPNRTQKLLMERGYGMFIHFGMNTFLQEEWSDGKASPDTYNPTRLDSGQWVRVAKEAGFRYVLLVTKHHDGFCMWDSRYTDYDVMASPVKVDVVKAVSDACRKYGLKFAVYYSLWDRYEPSYRDTDFCKYIDFMINQLEELFTNYGDICELWFDGAWDKPADDWQFRRLYDKVKEWQPTCAVGINNAIMREEKVDAGGFGMAMPDEMIEGNTMYTRYFPMDFRLADPKIAHKKDCKQVVYKGESYYMPFEHTICLSKRWNWFQKNTPMEVRDLDELEELFYWCTDNGNTLVVNVPPDERGLIRENEADAIIELGRRIGLKRGKPLPRNGEFISLDAPVEATSVWENHPDYTADKAVDGGPTTRWASGILTPELVITLDPSKPFNKVTIFEYQDEQRGADYFTSTRVNRIERYTIDIWKDGAWECIYISDTPMGDCKVIRFPREYRSEKIRLNVLSARDYPSIYEFNVMYKK